MRLHRLFFFLTILLLPTQLGYHMWPDWTLVLGRRIDYLSPTLFLTDITIGLTLLSWCIEKKQHIHLTKNQFYLFLITIGFIVCNIVLSSHYENALYQWIKYAEFFFFGVYIYKTKPKKLLIIPLIIDLWYSIGLAITQFILQHSIGGIWWFFGERTFTVFTPDIAKLNWCFPTALHCQELLRPYATFPHPNVLAGFLATLLPMLLYIGTTSKQRLIKIICYSSLGIGCMALFITFSRSAWLVTLLAMGYVWYMTKQTKHSIIFISVISILLLTIFCVPYIRTLSIRDESFFIRATLFFASWNLWKSHPLFGIGAGNFIPMLPAVLSAHDMYVLQPVHNIFMLLLSELGLVGFFGMIYAFIHHILIQKKEIHWIWWLPFIILCALGFVDHYPITLQQGLLLFTISTSIGFSSFTKN